MTSLRTVLLACFSIAFFLGVVHAEKGADLKPAQAKPGKVILDEHFDGQELAKGWTANKGDWQIKDGSVVGKEKKEDMHAAVLTLAQPFKNTIIRFSFKRDGATGVNLSFNHAKGHLFRIAINDTGLTINKDKDKKDASSKPAVLAKADGKFPPGQWQTLLIEIHGDQVAVQADNGVKLQASDPGLAVEKTGYRFVARGASLLLDDLTIWQVEP
jgi:3-keto-disaccharide hydrolase